MLSRLPKSVSDYSLKSNDHYLRTSVSKNSLDSATAFDRRKSGSSSQCSVKSGYSSLSIGSLSSSDDAGSIVSGKKCRSISGQSIISCGRDSTFSGHRSSSLYSSSSRDSSVVRLPRVRRPIHDNSYLSQLIRRLVT